TKVRRRPAESVGLAANLAATEPLARPAIRAHVSPASAASNDAAGNPSRTCRASCGANSSCARARPAATILAVPGTCHTCSRATGVLTPSGLDMRSICVNRAMTWPITHRRTQCEPIEQSRQIRGNVASVLVQETHSDDPDVIEFVWRSSALLLPSRTPMGDVGLSCLSTIDHVGMLPGQCCCLGEPARVTERL